jgi:hypothetical protein
MMPRSKNDWQRFGRKRQTNRNPFEASLPVRFKDGPETSKTLLRQATRAEILEPIIRRSFYEYF